VSESALTPKREKFAQCVAAGMNQSDAYRAAFDAGRMKPNVVNVKASQLMADGNVRVRVDELRKPAAEAAQITLESHLADLKALRNMAAKAEQYSAAIAAEVARGKHAGVAAAEKREHGGIAGAAPIPVTSVSPEEYRRITADVAAKT